MNYRRVSHSFPPFYDRDSKILILGSFPSVKSLEEQFYYANPGNRFYSVLSLLLKEEVGGTTTERKEFLQKHHIALFDVIAECTIKGSSDQSIKDVVVNDIQAIVEESQIKAVFTTGKTASRLYEKYIQCSVPHYSLPSTSGANAKMSLNDLADEYKKILEYL